MNVKDSVTKHLAQEVVRAFGGTVAAKKAKLYAYAEPPSVELSDGRRYLWDGHEWKCEHAYGLNMGDMTDMESAYLILQEDLDRGNELDVVFQYCPHCGAELPPRGQP